MPTAGRRPIDVKALQTEVLVIGGGATGTGVARDLAMRGFKTVLVEKRDLTVGTTGRYHGLLHSGGRYVVKDPQAARECIEENRVLRRIMPFCIEDTGGYFVSTPWDDPAYAPQFVAGCRAAGIPVEEVPTSQMLREEPLLNPMITRCFRVPDAAADSFLAADANVESARQHGAQILNYHEVRDLIREDDRIRGARCLDLVGDEQISILADMVVNASGAWAGKIAATAGIPVRIIPGKGTMIAANHRIVNTVINRCKPPGDGDILVPIHTVAVIGTTDVPVADPDHFAIQPWEVELMLEEGEKIVPGFSEMRMLRAWAGVRPLYQETQVSDTRDITRAYVLLDHQVRDGVSGLVTITSGKWTTYRQMAEASVDLVCQKLGVQRACRTHLEALPKPGYLRRKKPSSDGAASSAKDSWRGPGGGGYHQLGAPLREIEHDQAYGDLICECELATLAEVKEAIQAGAQTIDDVRRDVRLGMGPCQGGFCTYRVTGLLHASNQPPVEKTNAALHDFLQERWKGLLPVLWGQQLRQERLNTLIYDSLLNVAGLPGPKASALAPEMYAEPQDGQMAPPGAAKVKAAPETQPVDRQEIAETKHFAPTLDVLVIGAGLAGLTAAWQLARRGKRVRVISQGWGANHWHAGCIDVLGQQPGDPSAAPFGLGESLERWIAANPEHPYTLAGSESLQAALEALKELGAAAGYPLLGSLERNWSLPTAAGAARLTCLAPQTMTAGDLTQAGPALIVGFKGFHDFYPNLIADNLSVQGIPACGVSLALPSLERLRFVSGRLLANLFEGADFQAQVAEALAKEIKRQGLSLEFERTGFPAALGLNRALEVKGELEASLVRPVFEIPGLPPSIPGMRLHNLLVNEIERHGGRVYDGMAAVSADGDGRQITTVWSEAAGRPKAHRARVYVLATGDFLGGGIATRPGGLPREGVFDLPVTAPDQGQGWFQEVFLAPGGHPLFRAGLRVNERFQPVDRQGDPVYENLYAAGSLLAGCDVVQERSLEGVALVSGFLVGNGIE